MTRRSACDRPVPEPRPSRYADRCVTEPSSDTVKRETRLRSAVTGCIEPTTVRPNVDAELIEVAELSDALYLREALDFVTLPTSGRADPEAGSISSAASATTSG